MTTPIQEQVLDLRKTVEEKAERIAELKKALENLLTMCIEHPAVYDGATEIKAARKALEVQS